MPTPNSGEKKKDYISRCVGVRQNEHPDEDSDQSVAICNSMWDKAKKLEKIEEIDDPMLGTSHGASNATPEAVIPGAYPEFEQVELTGNLKKKPWERDGWE